MIGVLTDHPFRAWHSSRARGSILRRPEPGSAKQLLRPRARQTTAEHPGRCAPEHEPQKVVAAPRLGRCARRPAPGRADLARRHRALTERTLRPDPHTARWPPTLAGSDQTRRRGSRRLTRTARRCPPPGSQGGRRAGRGPGSPHRAEPGSRGYRGRSRRCWRWCSGCSSDGTSDGLRRQGRRQEGAPGLWSALSPLAAR